MVSILFNSTQKEIIELISTHFCVDDIKQAKTVLCDLVNDKFQERRSTDLRTDKYAHSQDMVNILKKIDKKCMPYFVIDSYGLVKLTRINPEDLSSYAVSEKLPQLTTKFNILCMEVHDNTTHIKLNENSIMSIMGNDGEGGMAVPPSAPLRARYSEGCLVVRNSEPKETGDSVGVLAVLPTAPPETGDAVGCMNVPSSAPPELGE